MGTSPPERPPQRFRLPVRQPLRELLIASLCATIGSFEVIAWATFGLGGPLLIAGILLILVGLGYALWCLIRFWRTRWVVRLTANELTVTSGSRQRRLHWAEIGEVRVGRNQVEIFDGHGKKQLTLGVDRTRRAHEALHSMLDAIEVHRARQ
ncbi:MAG TPA: hypothetical protein VE462_05015 [Propionibacteriaceae bacterium]|nr:hypothetical protein [Propionibacteriaceae bacterium]